VGRLHLFEFEDQQWCPEVLRNAVTGYLRLAVVITQQLRPVVPALAAFLRETGETSILDLCSGSGGLAGQLARGLARRGTPARILLTDLYPDTAAFEDVARRCEGLVEFRAEPLDATEVAGHLPGLRTMFNAFHHFRPGEARRVLAAAAASGRPIAIIEFVERGVIPLSGIFFSPFLVLFLAPFLRPFRWQALFFTYLVPLVPLMIFWDGLVSWLRVYSLAELRELAAAASVPGYSWEAGHWRAGPVRVTYLLGRQDRPRQ
jgi:SAM-dependent methyltransferase